MYEPYSRKGTVQQQVIESKAEDRAPLDFPKPLSEEHQRIIDLLREHNEHTDRPLVLCESEFYVTLRVPKVHSFKVDR
jgi:hypothetical protein